MPDRTALSMEIALGVAISQYPKGTFLTATADVAKSLLATPMWKRLIIWMFILQIHILLGNGVPMRMQTVYIESFFRKERILLKCRMKTLPAHSI